MAIVRLGKTTSVSGVIGKGGGLFVGGTPLSGGSSGGGGTTVTPRTPEQQAAFFESRGIVDTTPVGRTPSGALLFQTKEGKILSTNDLSLLTPSGKDFVKLTTTTRAEAERQVSLGLLSPQALGRPKPTPTTPTLQEQSQQPTTITQEQIQQQIVRPDRTGFIGGLQKFGRLVFDPDAISGGKKIFKDTSDKTKISLAPVKESILESEPVQLLVKKPGEKVISGIDVVEKKIRDTLQPKTVSEEILVKETAQTVELAKQHEKNTDERNKKVNELNKKYGGKELTPKEFAEYTADKTRIENTDTRLKQTELFLEQQEARLKSKEKGLRIERENAPSQFVTSILVGIATFPVGIAKLGIGVVTKPVLTIKETAKGIKDLPKQFAEKPISVTGEVVGQVLAGVVAGQVIKTFKPSKVKAPLSEAKRIKTATNKALGLSDEIKTQTVTGQEQLALKKNFLESGKFADDANVQDLVQTGSIGKAVKTTASGRETIRYIIKGSSGGKEYVMTFSETATGKVRGVKLAVTEQGITKVYRPASPSEIKQPTAPKITDKPTIKITKIDQLKQTGVFAKKTKVIAKKQVQVGEKTIKISKAETKVFQVGKGSAKTKSLAEALRLDKQPQVVKLLKKPRQVAKVKSIKFEVQKQPTAEIIGKDLLIKQDSLAIEKSISKFTKPPLELDIKKIVGKKKAPVIDKSIITKKTINKVINEIDTPSSTPTAKVIKVDLKEVLPEALSPQELGFNLRKARPPKVKLPSVKEVTLGDTKFTGLELGGKIGIDLTKGEGDLGVIGRIPTGTLDMNIKKIERKTKVLDLNKLQQIEKTRVKKKQRQVGSEKIILKRTPRTIDITKNIIKEMQRGGITQKQTQRQKQIQRQIQKLSQIQVPIQSQPPRRPRTPLKTITPKIFLPKSRRQEDIYKRLLKKQRKRTVKLKSSYTASLGAAAFQVKPIKVSRKEFERLSKVRFTGAETRPLLQIEEDKELKKQIKSVQF